MITGLVCGIVMGDVKTAMEVFSSHPANLYGCIFLQEILDKVLSGLLPLCVVSGVYFYFVKKGMKVTRALVGLTVILGVLAAIGIL